jgi:tetratricopeptide (TPR) repeat protein
VAKKQPDEAIAAFTEVLRLNPGFVPAQLQRAGLQMTTGQFASALQSAQAAASVSDYWKNDATVRLILARALIANRDVTGAETELKTLEAQHPKVPEVQATMGSMLLAKGDLAGARQAFGKALALDPNSNEALTGLVTLDWAAKKLPEGMARVEARLARTPNDPVVLILAARTYNTAGDKAKAEQVLLKTLEVAPDTLEAYYLLGQMYADQMKLDEARKMFAGMAARQTKPVGAKTMVGILLELQGKRAEARKQYEEVLAMDPRAAVAANNLACIYVDSGGNLDIAQQLAQSAKAMLPNVPQVNDTLGWIFYKKGLTSLAVEPLRLAVDQDKDPKNPRFQKNPAYQFHLGMALAKSGKNAEARTALQAALALKQPFAGEDEARKTLASLK